MKVVHIFKDYYPPTPGGIEQHMRLLCEHLSRHVTVNVLVPSRSFRRIEESLKGVSVVRVPEFGRWASVPLCPSMPRELARLRPDLVHLHFPNPMGDLTFLLAASHTPLVISYHADIIRQRTLLPLYQPILDLVLARARRVIASSDHYVASSRLLSRYREKCAVVPYGVDLDDLALRDGEAAEVKRIRSQYGDRLVLLVGVLRPYKGAEVLLRAMTRVRGRALIAGPGLRTSLEVLARRLGVADRITFLGEVTEDRLRLLLHAGDLLALPSTDRREAFGIVQLEAMACGKPVVASDLPTGVRLVNRHEVTGLLVAPREPQALASALNRLLDDPNLRTRLGRAARDQVERRFTAERMVRDTLRVYEEVLATTTG